MTGQIAIEEIERKRQKIDSLSQYIWNHPEAGFKEYKAQEKVADLLREEGFQVETGAGGVPTAIKAVYGSGHPVMGFWVSLTRCRDSARRCRSTRSQWRDSPMDTAAAITCCVPPMWPA